MSEIKIYSRFGVITAEPMAMVDIKKSIHEANPLAPVANDPAQGAEDDTVSLDPETEQ